MRSAGVRADVVVVGGGVAGTSVAAALVRRGVEVAWLRDDLEGASSRGLGHGLPGVVEPPHRTERSLGVARMAELLGWVDRSRAVLGPLATPGLTWVAAHPGEAAGLDDDVATLRRHGWRAERVTTDLGEGFHTSGGFSVRPHEALRALAPPVADPLGGWAVSEVRTVSDGLEVVGSGGVVRCEMVVLACGFRAPALDPWFAERVVPVREQALAATGAPRVGAWRHGSGWTAIAGSGGDVEVSGSRWASPHLEVGETEDQPTERIQGRLEAFARRVGAGEVTRRWAWIEAHTCDGLPFVGPLPGDPRRVALVGFCGNDWGLAPGAAEEVAEGLVSGRSPTSVGAPTRMV